MSEEMKDKEKPTEAKPEAKPAAEVPAEKKEEKKEEAPTKPAKKELVRPTNCAACNKAFTHRRWYYKNGQHFCTKRCWKKFVAERKKEAAEKAAKEAQEKEAAEKAAKEAQEKEAEKKPEGKQEGDASTGENKTVK